LGITGYSTVANEVFAKHVANVVGGGPRFDMLQ
jgi:hypothetical protein